ncbi:hypothetical protein BRD20_08585 [Halobacteriales archaeon SW_8_65_20]|nr:MAG: hypothetical protein BRD20_08585 [Halobacteriales archaeon SW_8_65_20]
MPEATARERVTARLAQLRGSYDGFDIRQTTVTVSPAEFAEIVDDEETVLAEIRVENETGDRLLVDGPGGWQPPSTTVSTGQLVSRIGDEAYQLQLRFLAAPERGEPRPPAAWRES